MAVPNKLLSMLGIAAKAHHLASGEFQTEEAVKSGKAELVLLSADASANTCKKFTDMCSFYQVECQQLTEDMETIGHAIGKAQRSSLALTDFGLAQVIRGLL